MTHTATPHRQETKGQWDTKEGGIVTVWRTLSVGATPTPRRFALSQGSFNSDLDKWVWTFDRWTQPNRVYICSTHPQAGTLHSKSTTFAIPWSFW